MTDERHDPHGPEKLPDRHPTPSRADPSTDPKLPAGATSRWLVPAAVLAAVATVLYVLAFQTDQVILPVLGIVWVVGMWIVMMAMSRGGGDIRGRNRRLAVLMGTLAAGAVLVFIGIYLVATLGEA